MWKAGQLNAHPWFPNICFSKLLNPTDLDIVLPCVAPPSTDFSWKPTYRKTQFLDSTLKFIPNKKRSNCDYAQPTWLFAHHLVMKHSELSLTTTYHPVNAGRSKSKHGQHPNHSICCDLLVEVVIFKCRDFQIIAKQHHHESQFQKLTSWPKLISKLLGI